MNDEFLQAAREAWRRDPENAAVAILGVSAESLFCEAVKAARGCNQHGHKPGCPDAGHENNGKHGERRKPSDSPESAKKTLAKGNSMSEYLAKSLTDDIYEIALEDGGYESLYDAPKDKLKAAIMKELQATPKDEADKLGDDAYDSYKWWQKRKEKIAKSLK